MAELENTLKHNKVIIAKKMQLVNDEFNENMLYSNNMKNRNRYFTLALSLTISLRNGTSNYRSFKLARIFLLHSAIDGVVVDWKK